MTTTLIVPGLNSSGSAHWQTWLESQIPGAIRVIQADWKRANLPEWASRVRREISRRPGPILIAAHSFGALAAVQAAEDYRERIVGALLVAPADPDKFSVTDLLPAGPLGFPAKVVASRNDPWLRFERAAELAAMWRADLVDLGPSGHINAEAGYGPWPYGLSLLDRLAAVSPQANQLFAHSSQWNASWGQRQDASASLQRRADEGRHSAASHSGFSGDYEKLSAGHRRIA